MSIKSITSRDNPQLKAIKQLATSAQARKKAGQTLLDGIHLCQTWLQQQGAPALCVVGEAARGLPEVARIMADCQARQVSCLLLPDALFAGLSQVDNGVALLFLIDIPKTLAVPRLTQSALLLDQLQDPGNLGSILRSAAAAGIEQVFCSSGTVFAWSPKVLRAGMGAHFALQIFEQVDLEALIKAATVPVWATSSYATRSIFEADLTAPLAWIFGHEGQGVTPALLALANVAVKIPQSKNVESVNVAAAVAVCVFEQLRQSAQRGKAHST